MGDVVDLFSTMFDTAVPAAGDASSVADAVSAAGDTSSAADAASTAADVASAAPIDESAGLDMTPAASVPDAAATDPGANTDSGIPPGEQMPAQKPIEELPQVHAGTLDAMDTYNGPHKGLIDQASQWAKDNPGSAKVVGDMLKGGATGAMTALAMRNKMQAERDKEERARQDVIRRGQVAPLPAGTFTPKPGIIAGARG